MAKRFERNRALRSECFVALHEGTVAGFTWTNERVLELVGMRARELPEGAVHIHHAFVFPEHRGKKVLQCLLCSIYRGAQESGRTSAVCLVDRADGPAVAAFGKMGVAFHRAPAIKLPGLRPIILGAPCGTEGSG